MNVIVAPSLMCSDFRKLEEEIRLFEDRGVEMLHLDIMDGHFVPNITMGPPLVQAIAAMTALRLDVHMMVEPPDGLIPAMASERETIISVHLEAVDRLERTLELIRSIGGRPAIAVNPETGVEELEPVLDSVYLVLLMCVTPGFSGRRLVPHSIEKIAAVRNLLDRRGLSPLLEVDGNTTLENIRGMVEAGADVIVAGTSCLYRKDRSLADALDELLDFVSGL